MDAMRAYGAARVDRESEDVEAFTSTETTSRRRAHTFRAVGLAVAIGALVACGAMMHTARGGKVIAIGDGLDAQADDGVTGVDPTAPPGPSNYTSCLDACGADVKDRVMMLLDMRSCGELDGVDKSCLSNAACDGVRANVEEECPDVL